MLLPRVVLTVILMLLPRVVLTMILMLLFNARKANDHVLWGCSSRIALAAVVIAAVTVAAVV